MWSCARVARRAAARENLGHAPPSRSLVKPSRLLDVTQRARPYESRSLCTANRDTNKPPSSDAIFLAVIEWLRSDFKTKRISKKKIFFLIGEEFLLKSIVCKSSGWNDEWKGSRVCTEQPSRAGSSTAARVNRRSYRLHVPTTTTTTHPHRRLSLFSHSWLYWRLPAIARFDRSEKDFMFWQG